MQTLAELTTPEHFKGLRHVALFVTDLTACISFYQDILGYQMEWQPDPENCYLTSGTDNLALHQLPQGQTLKQPERLDHIGMVVTKPELVDAWHSYLQSHHVRILTAPKTHRDGARSFYCEDPNGTRLQIIHHPPISGAA
jgi:catechol 2,3-dioxygenase-like lactoylglutathione lyase family enzyme